MNPKMAALGAVLATWMTSAAFAEEPIRIGFITTLTTPAAAIGNDMVDAVKLAVDHAGGTIAGHPIEVIYEDDGLQPDLGRQKAGKAGAPGEGRCRRRIHLVERPDGRAQDGD